MTAYGYIRDPIRDQLRWSMHPPPCKVWSPRLSPPPKRKHQTTPSALENKKANLRNPREGRYDGGFICLCSLAVFLVLRSKCVQRLEADSIKVMLELSRTARTGHVIPSASPLPVEAHNPSLSPPVPKPRSQITSPAIPPGMMSR